MTPPRYETLLSALLSPRKIHYGNKSSGTLLCPSQMPTLAEIVKRTPQRGLTTILYLLMSLLSCLSSSEREKLDDIVHLLRIIIGRYEDISHIESEMLGLERERYWNLIPLGRHPLIREYSEGLDNLSSLRLVDVWQLRFNWLEKFACLLSPIALHIMEAA